MRTSPENGTSVSYTHLPDEYQAISIVSSRTGTVAQAIAIDDAVKAVNAKLLRFEMAIDAGKQCGQGCLFVLGAENISDARRLVELSVSYTHLDVYKRQGVYLPEPSQS